MNAFLDGNQQKVLEEPRSKGPESYEPYTLNLGCAPFARRPDSSIS